MRVLFVVVASLLLSACFDIDQKLTVREDGTSTYQIDLAVNANLIAMSSKDDPDVLKNFCKDQVGKEKIKGFEVSSRQEMRGKDIACIMTMTGETEELLAYLSTPQEHKGSMKPPLLNYKDIGGGRYRLESNVSELFTEGKGNPFKKNDAEGSEADEMGQRMAEMMLSDAGITMTFAASEIHDSNGKISEDKKSVEYGVPMLLLMKEQADPFWVEYSVTEPGILDTIKGWFTR